MTAFGTTDTRLVILRGNSASGKTTIAHAVRERFGRGLAIVSQDVIRRELLWEKDCPGAVNIGLLDTIVRYTIGRGVQVVLEGIMESNRYGEMLARLQADHRGTTTAFSFDIPFDVTVKRHATKPQVREYGEEMMRSWYRAGDLVPALHEHRIGPDTGFDEIVDLVIARSGLIVPPVDRGTGFT